MNEDLLPAILLILLLIVIITTHSERSDCPFPFKVIAHRGASLYAPEHTAIALEKAIQMKADYVEIDVQLSKDNHLILFHDFTVNRTTNGTGYINQLTLKELKCLDAGSWFHPSFKGLQVLTLEEALERYSRQIKFLIEIKNPHLHPTIENRLAKTLFNKLPNTILNETIVQSFDLNSIKLINKYLPQLQTGLLRNFDSKISKQAIKKWAKHVNYLNPHFLTINSELVDDLHRNGLKVFPWVVNNQEIAMKMFSFNVDGIITNNPLIKQKLLPFVQPPKIGCNLEYSLQEDNITNWSRIFKNLDYDKFNKFVNYFINKFILK